MYCYETLLSAAKVMNSKQCAILTEKPLTELLQTAATSFVTNFRALVSRTQVYNKSVKHAIAT